MTGTGSILLLLYILIMSDSTQMEEKNFVRFVDFCTKPDFQVARYQLVREIKKFQAHQIHTSIKDSGIQWSKLFDAMFNDDFGMLRGYKKPRVIEIFVFL